MSKLSRSRSRRERAPPPAPGLDDSASEFSSLCTAIVAPKLEERIGGQKIGSQRSQRSQAPLKSSVFEEEEVVSLSLAAPSVAAPSVAAPSVAAPPPPCPVCQQPAVGPQHLKVCGARHGLTTQVLSARQSSTSAPDSCLTPDSWLLAPA